MLSETLDGFLDRLASGDPTPGGGAGAAVQAGLACALVAMVARCTAAERFPRSSPDAAEIARAADALRGRALALVTQDEKAFGQVAAAYRHPSKTAEGRDDRAAAIAVAMEAATQPPIAVLELTEKVVDLAERLLPIANPHATADLAAAADATAAATRTSRLNVESNLRAIGDPVARSRLRSRMGDVDKTLERAHRLTEAVWGRLDG